MLPAFIATHRPQALGTESQALAEKNQLNVNDAANLIAIEKTAESDLPPFLRESKRLQDEGKRLVAEGQSKSAEQLAEFTRYQNLRDQAAINRNNLAAGVALLERAKLDPIGLQKDIAGWPAKPLSELFGRINAVLIAERLMIELPKWIKTAEAELKTLETEVTALAKKFQ